MIRGTKISKIYLLLNTDWFQSYSDSHQTNVAVRVIDHKQQRLFFLWLFCYDATLVGPVQSFTTLSFFKGFSHIPISQLRFSQYHELCHCQWIIGRLEGVYMGISLWNLQPGCLESWYRLALRSVDFWPAWADLWSPVQHATSFILRQSTKMRKNLPHIV